VPGTFFWHLFPFLPLIGPLLDSVFLKREWRRIIDDSLENLRTHFEDQG
jgi:hypothetical protein